MKVILALVACSCFLAFGGVFGGDGTRPAALAAECRVCRQEIHWEARLFDLLALAPDQTLSERPNPPSGLSTPTKKINSHRWENRLDDALNTSLAASFAALSLAVATFLVSFSAPLFTEVRGYLAAVSATTFEEALKLTTLEEDKKSRIRLALELRNAARFALCAFLAFLIFLAETLTLDTALVGGDATNENSSPWLMHFLAARHISPDWELAVSGAIFMTGVCLLIRAAWSVRRVLGYVGGKRVRS